MRANTPEEICRLFRHYMADGDVDAVVGLYDPEVVFLNRQGESVQGQQALRTELAPFAAARAAFDFDIKQVIRAGDIALMHTQWQVSSPEPIAVYAIEVARRQPDGSWRWLIGDPFTVGKHTAS